MIGGPDYDRVNAIKYNPLGDKVFGAMDTLSSIKKNPGFVVLNAKDGSVLKTLKFINEFIFSNRRTGLMLFDNTDKLYFGFTL